jgi:hypothetical protein
MRRIYLAPFLSALLFLGACNDDTELTGICTATSCWINSLGEIRAEFPPFEEGPQMGCHLGTPVCDGNVVVACLGFQGPAQESCNGIDDDCDDEVDEYLDDVYDYNDCWDQLEGVCRMSDRLCLGGQYVCVPHVSPSPEVCDGRDNDCDGETDEDIPTEFFYPEDSFPNTLGVGECRPGIRRCVDRQIQTVDPVLPGNEVCSSGRDEDCDGFTDEVESGPLEASFVLVIDKSTSMNGYIAAVKNALCSWASDPAFTWSWFAVILIADGPVGDPYVYIAQDFMDASLTCTTLTSVTTVNSTGEEHQLTGILTSEALSWPEDTDRHVIVFSDEHIQPLYDSEPAEVQDSCVANDYRLGVFTVSPHDSSWYPYLNSCGGFIEFLDSDAEEMEEVLRSWFAGAC